MFQALDLVHVAVVVYLAVGLVEVQVAVGHGGVGLTVPVEAGAAGALARGAVARHVVDHGVHNDPVEGEAELVLHPPAYLHHAHAVALLHHVDEAVPVAGPAGQNVGDRLVPT